MFVFRGDMLRFVFVSVLLLVISCSEDAGSAYSLPDECGGKCFVAHDTTSFQDAAVNSAAAFSNCVCLGEGVFEGSVTIAKPLKLIGRKDGTSYLKNLAVSETSGVLLRDFSFKDFSSESAALFISGSSIEIENVSFSNIGAASVFGGRGIVVSGKGSEVFIRNSKIEKTDGTGILINGPHKVFLENVDVSECGFAGIWAQNQSDDEGILSVSGSKINGNSAVAVEILGRTSLKISGSRIENVKKRDVALETVGDGIVVKNPFLSENGSVAIENSSVSDFARAGIILDGDDSRASPGAIFKNLSISSVAGSFGLVVQNAPEDQALREGIVQNSFSSADMKRDAELFIVDTFFELK